MTGVLFQQIAVTHYVFGAALLLSTCSATAQRAGDVDPNFGENSNGLQIFGSDSNLINATASTAEGEIYAVGSTSQSKFSLMKIDRFGLLDSELGIVKYDPPPGFTQGTFYGVHILTDGMIMAAGRAASGPNDTAILCRIYPSGMVDKTFAPDGDTPGCLLIELLDSAGAIAEESDGSIIVGGWSRRNDTIARSAIVRISPDGLVDMGFAAGGGLALLPDSYTANSYTPDVSVSEDGKTITALAATAKDLILVRYTADGLLDSTFSGDGTMTAMQHSRLLGMHVSANGAITLAGMLDSDDTREIDLLKFDSSGNPVVAFNGPNSPPGRSQIAICNNDCMLTLTECVGGMTPADGNRLLLGAVTYFPAIDASRAVSVRVDGLTGNSDAHYGNAGENENTPIGVGRGIAVPGDISGPCAVFRGDRPTVIGARNPNQNQIAAWGFLGDQLFIDGYE